MKVYLGIGSNLEDREHNLNDAVERINANVGAVTKASSMYETEPWGFETDDLFLNMAVEVETDLNPAELMEALKKIEHRMGRIKDRDEYTSRIIDIDILLYEDVIVNDVNLKIPHPLMAERNFVLVPLREIAPDAMHPVLGKTVAELLNVCSDTGVVHLHAV